jgi:predicted ArsR family transcriptional regulator
MSRADLFAYPNAPGAQDRGTSRAAGEASTAAAPLLRAMALDVLKRSNGLTADQVAGRLGKSILSIRPRITELARLGKVRDTGDRRPNASGRTAIVWAAVQPARLNRSRSCKG